LDFGEADFSRPDNIELKRKSRQVESGPPEFATASFEDHPTGGMQLLSIPMNSHAVMGWRLGIPTSSH